VDGQLAARFAKDAAEAGVEVEALGGEVELLLRDLPGIDSGSDLLGRLDRRWTSVLVRGSTRCRLALRVVSRTAPRFARASE
jgi:hypothetical protein